MPTLKDQILEFLADRPSKTDREITNAIKGRSAAPQGVNQVQWGLWCECASSLIQTHNLPNFVMVIDCPVAGPNDAKSRRCRFLPLPRTPSTLTDALRISVKIEVS